MTIDAKCLVCKNADRRRLIELGWNGGMAAATIANVLDIKGLAATTIIRHLKQHADGDGNRRAVEVEPELPARERVIALQKLQLDEVERRIGLARSRADLLNKEHENDPDWHPADWSDFFDVLGKDGQSAIGSILKAQGLTDKRDMKRDDLKLGLFEAMAKSGLAPKSISGGAPALPDPDEELDVED